MADEEKKAERRKKRKEHKRDRKVLGVVKATGRRVRDAVDDIKQSSKRRKAARPGKKATRIAERERRKGMDFSSKRSEYRDTRESRLKDKSKETKTIEAKDAKFVSRTRGKRGWSKEERADMKGLGVKTKRLSRKKASEPSKIKSTVGAKRAGRVLDRMDKREQNKLGRKQKKTIRQNRMDTKKSPSAGPKKKYEKDMKKKGIDINKKVSGLKTIVK